MYISQLYALNSTVGWNQDVGSAPFVGSKYGAPSCLEIEGYIKGARYSSEMGPDDVPIAIIKQDGKAWAEFLHPLFVHCYTHGVIPQSWKGSRIAPLYKKGPKNSPASFRQISLLEETGKFAKSFLIHLKD